MPYVIELVEDAEFECASKVFRKRVGIIVIHGAFTFHFHVESVDEFVAR